MPTSCPMFNGSDVSQLSKRDHDDLSSLPMNLVKAFELELERVFRSKLDVCDLYSVTEFRRRGGFAKYQSLLSARRDDMFDWRSSNLFANLVKTLNLNKDDKLEAVNLDLPEDEDLAFAFDHHSLITSQLPDSFDEPIKTADEVIREIDMIMGNDEELVFLPLEEEFTDGCLRNGSATLGTPPFTEAALETLSLNRLNGLLEDLETCVREHSAILVHELAYREELDFEQEQKDIFIARLDEMHRRLERRRRRSSMPPVDRNRFMHNSPIHSIRSQNGFDEPSPCAKNSDRSPGSSQKDGIPVLTRAQSAAHAAVAAASSATTLLKRKWHRLSRGADELTDFATAERHSYDTAPRSSDGVESADDSREPRMDEQERCRSAASAADTTTSSRAVTIARLRKWASRKAHGALTSVGTTGSFRALLHRTGQYSGTDKTPISYMREARSAVTTPTSSHADSPVVPSTLVHSASGHLVGSHELNSNDLEYKNLSTTIPYHRSPHNKGPTVEELQLFNEMLLAILTNNPNLTPMLTDYILNVYAPADRRPSRLPI